MDVKIPKFNAIISDANSLSQTTDWANIYHKSSSFSNKGEGAIIFIIDTAGTYQDHDDLKGNNPVYLNGNSTTDSDKDVNGHGTHCGGIAAAVDNNSGVIGIAPKSLLGARKALGDNGSGSYAWIAKEIKAVADLELSSDHRDRRKIISLSLGGASSNSSLREAINYAIDKGCFIIAAAGNSGYNGKSTVNYPANYPEVIAVASIEKDEDPSVFSSGGDNVDVSAYGDGNFSTYKNNTYATLRGTSMATPVVSGLVALIVTEFPEIDSQSKLMFYLKESAKDLFTDGFDVRTGYGTLITTDFKKPSNSPGQPDKEPSPPQVPIVPSNPISEKLGVWIDEPFIVYARNEGEEWSNVAVKVAASVHVSNESKLKEAVDIVYKFFKNRGFYFLANTGIDKWAEYIGRFLYVVTKGWGIPIVAEKVWVNKKGISVSKDVNPTNFINTMSDSSDDITIDNQKTFEMKVKKMALELPEDKIGFSRDENLGVENIKVVITDAFSTLDAIIDLFSGKVESGLFKLAGVVGGYEDFLEALKQALAEFGDLSESEANEVYSHAAEAFDIEDDELELKIERVMKLPISGFAEYMDSVEVVDEIKKVWDSDAPSWEKFRTIFSLAGTSGFNQGEDLVALVMEMLGAIGDLFKKK
jgi:hypothetical protein